MSDTKGSSQTRNSARRWAEASAAANASRQRSAQGRSFAASEYWQGVAATGRAAKSAAVPQTKAAIVGHRRGRTT